MVAKKTAKKSIKKTEKKSKFSIPKEIIKSLFVEHQIDVKTDTPREEVIAEFKELFEGGKFDAIPEARRFNTIRGVILRKYAADIKNPSPWFTGLFFDVSEPKDINKWKRENQVNQEGIPEKYVANAVGIIFDDESGDIVPFSLTMWEKVAEEAYNIPVGDAWVRFKAGLDKNDGDNYRILKSTTKTTFEITEPTLKGKPVDIISIEDAINEYYNIVTCKEFRKYVKSRVPTPIKAGVISVTTSPNDNGNYSYLVMDDDVDISVDSEVIRIVTQDRPKYDIGSEIIAFGTNAFEASDNDKDKDNESEEKKADIILMASLILPTECVIELNVEEADFEEEDDFDSVTEEFDDEEEEEEEDDDESEEEDDDESEEEDDDKSEEEDDDELEFIDDEEEEEEDE